MTAGKFRLLPVGLATLLAACSLNPAYQSPAPSTVTRYTDTELPASVGASSVSSSQQLVVGGQITEKWWRLFNAEVLDQLVATTLQNNAELSAAAAAIEQAQQGYYAQRGMRQLPAVDLNAGIVRQKFSGASVGFPDVPNTTLTLFNASVDVSYNVDLFGKEDNLTLLAQQQRDQSYWQREALYLMLVANVVNQAIELAALTDQLDEYQQWRKLVQQQLNLVQQDILLGGAAATAVLPLQRQLTLLSTTQLELQKKQAFARHQLAVLSGQSPSQPVLAALSLQQLSLPQTLPVSVPSHLVQQRPDIQLAENVIKSRYAELGIARANQLPQLSLNAGYGTLTTDSANLFEPASMIWDVGAAISQPLFRAGELKHKKAAAEAGLKVANAQYQHAVLQAFKQVADSLRALEYDGAAHAEALVALQRDTALLNQLQQQYQLGAISQQQLLQEQLQLHQSKIALIQAHAAQLSDSVALFQALGGGKKSVPD